MEFNAPVEIAAWLGCLAFGLLLTNEGAKFVDRIRGKAPHPPNEQLEFSVTTMDRRGWQLAGELRAEKLHNRINPIAEGMEGLKSAVDLNNQQTVLLGGKLDRLMENKR